MAGQHINPIREPRSMPKRKRKQQGGGQINKRNVHRRDYPHAAIFKVPQS